MESLSVAHFKEAVGHFATGVVVVTGLRDGTPAGFTCQTFGSLSLEPILISFAADRASASWARVRDVEVFGVNVLADAQEVLARTFATSGIDKFAGVGWTAGPGGAPLLEGAIAHLEARIISVSAHGDHDVVVGEVDFVATHPGRPLLFYRGGFNCLA